MSYVALYRKWRPMTFDEVVEQSGVVSILKNAVMSERLSHAYLFCGTRGTGKTTMAKIFARAVNCLNPVNGNPCNECAICKGIINQQILDVSEIDAASNNGVDNIRSIIDETTYSSTVAKYRVYIIDEVHMLSAGAFNALLKTLEEPPQNVIFILATTEPHKLPVTILSRCQRYDFKRISRDGIVRRLAEICDNSGIGYDPQALGFLAQKSDGAMRDAISLLDQTIAASGNGAITLETARNATGSLDKGFINDFTEAIIDSNSMRLLDYTDTIFRDGRDPSAFLEEVMNVLRNILIVLSVNEPQKLIYEDEDGLKKLKEIGKRTGIADVTHLIREISALDSSLKWAVQRKIIFETGMLSLCDRKWNSDSASIETRLTALEERLSDLVAKGIRISGTAPAVSEKPQIAETPVKEERKDTVSSVSVQTAQIPETGAVSSDSDKTSVVQSTPEITQEKSSVRSSVPAGFSGKIDPLDWQEFVQSLKDAGKTSSASLLEVGFKPVFVSENTLAICGNNPSLVKLLSKQLSGEFLEEQVSKAFGRKLSAQIIEEKELSSLKEINKPAAFHDEPAKESAASQKNNAPDEKAERFNSSVEKLKEFSGKMSFKIEEI